MTRWVFVAALIAGAVATGSRYGELRLGDEDLDAVLAITGPGAAQAKTVHSTIQNVREHVEDAEKNVEELAAVAAEREQRVERAESSATGSSELIFQLQQDAKEANSELKAAMKVHEDRLAVAAHEEHELLAGLAGDSIMQQAAHMLQQVITAETPLSGIEPALLTVASLIESEQRNSQREEARDAELCEGNLAMAERKIAASKREVASTAAVLKRREAALAGAREELQRHQADVDGIQTALDGNHLQIAQLREEVEAELESARLRDEEHNSAMQAATVALKALGEAVDAAPDAKADAPGKDMKFRRRRAQVAMAPAVAEDAALDAGSAPTAAADDWTAAVQWLQLSAGLSSEPWTPSPVTLRTPEEHAAAKSAAQEASDFERMLSAKRNAHSLRQLVRSLRVSIADSDPEAADVGRDRHLMHALEREHDRLQARLDAAGDVEEALRARVLTAQAFVSQATQRAADARSLLAAQQRFHATQAGPCEARRRAGEAAAAHRAFALHVVAEMTRAVRTFLASGESQEKGSAARTAFVKHLTEIEEQLSHPPATPAEQRAAAAAVLDRLKSQRARLLEAERKRLQTELCVYTSQRTDSVDFIAERFGVSVDALRAANRGTYSAGATASHAPLPQYPPVGTRVVIPRAGMDKTAQALCRWVPREGLVHLVMHDALEHMKAACGAEAGEVAALKRKAAREAEKYRALRRAAAKDPMHAVDEELYGRGGLFDDEPLRPLAATGGTGGAGQAIEANPYALPFDAPVPEHLQRALDKLAGKDGEEEEEAPAATGTGAGRRPRPSATGASATGAAGDAGVPFVPGFSNNGLGFDCDAYAEVDLGHKAVETVARDLSAAPGVSVEAWVSMPDLPARGDLTMLVSAVAETAVNPVSRVVDGLGPYRTGLYLAVGPRPGHPADKHPVFIFGVRGTGGNPLMTELDGAAVRAGAWAHVVGTYDGRVQRLFVNGALAAETHAQSGPVAFGWDAAHPRAVSDAARLRLLAGAVEATCSPTTLSHVALWRTALPQRIIREHAVSRAATGRAALAAAEARRVAARAAEAPDTPVRLTAFFPLTAAGAGGARSIENAGSVPLSGAVEPAHEASMTRRAMEAEASESQYGAGSIGRAGPSGVYVVGATGVHASAPGSGGVAGALTFSATGGYSVDTADLARRRREASVELAQAAAVAERWAQELSAMGPEAKALVAPLAEMKRSLNAVVEKQDAARARMEQAEVTMRDAELVGDTVARDAAAKFVRERRAALEEMRTERTHLENEIVGRHERLVQLQKDAAAATLKQQAATAAHARAVTKLQRLVQERRVLAAQVASAAMETEFQRAAQSVAAAQRGMAHAKQQGDDRMEATYMRRGLDAAEAARAFAEHQRTADQVAAGAQ